MKAPVTRDVLFDHFKGKRPFGIYMLLRDAIHFMVVDFDLEIVEIPLAFVRAARHYDIPSYIERSKSKGYHVWNFFEIDGVAAAKGRLVARHILEEIEAPDTEVFPKQDALSDQVSFGNFINAPLFGALVPHGRTVFLDEKTMAPHPNQWDFLEKVERTTENLLDEIIEVNQLCPQETKRQNAKTPSISNGKENALSRGLPICAQRMLKDGVQSNQRVACFRLAVQLKKAGLPLDIATAALKTWAPKNCPDPRKRIITEREITDQTTYAYTKPYQGCGCEETVIAMHCDPACPIHKRKGA